MQEEKEEEKEEEEIREAVAEGWSEKKRSRTSGSGSGSRTHGATGPLDFRVALGSPIPDMQKTLDVIEEHPEELDTTKVRAMDPQRAEKMELAQRSAQLYQVLARRG